jgi:hypothetical protein
VERVVLNALAKAGGGYAACSLAPSATAFGIGPEPDWHFSEKPIHLMSILRRKIRFICAIRG